MESTFSLTLINSDFKFMVLFKGDYIKIVHFRD